MLLKIAESLRQEEEKQFSGSDARFVRQPDGRLVIDHWCDGDEHEAQRVALKARRLIALQRKYIAALPKG